LLLLLADFMKCLACLCGQPRANNKVWNAKKIAVSAKKDRAQNCTAVPKLPGALCRQGELMRSQHCFVAAS